MYWLTGFLGIILVGAPFVLGYNDNQAALWTSLGIGVALTGASLFEWAESEEHSWEYWVLGVAGLAAVVAPFMLGFSFMSASTWTMLLSGFVAIGVSGNKLYWRRTHY